MCAPVSAPGFDDRRGPGFVGAKAGTDGKRTEHSAGRNWRPETALVHGGITRSQWNEAAEALYLTQGFVYIPPSRPKPAGRKIGLSYYTLRQSDDGVFEDRPKIFEGAEECLYRDGHGGRHRPICLTSAQATILSRRA